MLENQLKFILITNHPNGVTISATQQSPQKVHTLGLDFKDDLHLEAQNTWFTLTETEDPGSRSALWANSRKKDQQMTQFSKRLLWRTITSWGMYSLSNFTFWLLSISINPHTRICLLILERERDRETLVGCLPYTPQMGIKPTTLLVYGMMLQPTEPPRKGSHHLIYSPGSGSFLPMTFLVILKRYSLNSAIQYVTSLLLL